MAKMHIDEGDRPRVKLECLRMLATLKLDKARSAVIGAFMTNYLKLTSAENAVYNRMVATTKPKERKGVMEITNEWIDLGVKKGRKLGMRLGREEGQRKGRQEGRQEARGLVLRQLQRKVGDLPTRMSMQLDKLDDDAIFAIGEALFDFASVADVRRWLAKR